MSSAIKMMHLSLRYLISLLTHEIWSKLSQTEPFTSHNDFA